MKLLLIPLMSLASNYYVDIVSLDTKNENCRIIFEYKKIEHYKTVKCTDLNKEAGNVLSWMKKMKKQYEKN